MYLKEGIICASDGSVLVSRFPNVKYYNLEEAEKLSFPLVGFPSFEVSLIRIFFYDQEWHIATNGTLDAFEAKWSSPESFGYAFERMIYPLTADEFIQILDTEMKYFFLIPTLDENRLGMISNPSDQRVWLGGIQLQGEKRIRIGSEISDYKGPWKHLAPITLSTYEELCNYIHTTYDEVDGPIGFMTQDFIKVFHPEYQKRLNRRGNEQDIDTYLLKIYLEEGDLKDDIARQFPENVSKFKRYLATSLNVIRSLYVHRYCRREFTFLPQSIHFFLKVLHQQYLADRKPMNISIVSREFSKLKTHRARDLLIATLKLWEEAREHSQHPRRRGRHEGQHRPREHQEDSPPQRAPRGSRESQEDSPSQRAPRKS